MVDNCVGGCSRDGGFQWRGVVWSQITGKAGFVGLKPRRLPAEYADCRCKIGHQ